MIKFIVAMRMTSEGTRVLGGSSDGILDFSAEQQIRGQQLFHHGHGDHKGINILAESQAWRYCMHFHSVSSLHLQPNRRKLIFLANHIELKKKKTQTL
jgi:hypothetical protein